MSLSALDRLRLYLRPPGRGLYIHSTGGGYAARLLKSLYGTEDVNDAWEDSLQRIRRVDTLLVGLPCDTGAGILRGANFGPIGVREAYLKVYGRYPKNVVDVGDVIVIPQLLHDEMLAESQKEASRKALYPGVKEPLPVSPLSIAEDAFITLRELNPSARIVMIGGDHSVSWPAMVACHRRYADEFGLLHFDAHSDLTESRLGIRICFGTWANHTLKLLKPHHLVQVGVRTSMTSRSEWMQKLPVIQYWAPEIKGRENETITAIVEHFKSKGITKIYISNDIDGTDMEEAPATGTPEPQGLTANFVLTLTQAVQREFEIIGADVVEVAPPLSGLREFSGEKTCLLGARYLHAFLEGGRAL